MSQKLYIPIMNSNINKENQNEYVEIFKKLDAKTVFISSGRDSMFFDDRTDFLKDLKEKIKFFEENNFEVGVWIQAFGFGNVLDKETQKKTESFTRICSVTGNAADKISDTFCPSDKNFMKLFCNYVSDIASINPKMIMLDDDLCLSVRPGIGCFCDNHLKIYEKKIGEKIEIESLKDLLFTKSKNKYRSAWLEMMHDTLCEFCKEVRNAVDKVNENIRVGLCAGYTSWDIEGATTIELSKILAGKTKPFFRFTGAPYWVSKDINRFNFQRLNSVIECTRMQVKWCENEDIEMFCESDPYPRPRYHVPANYIEVFSLAMSTYENIGNLKYVCDYYSSTDYEVGYTNLALENKPIYDFIKKYFWNKKSYGVKIFEKMRKIEDAVLPEYFIGEEEIMKKFFSPAAAMLTSLAIPVIYDESDCVAVFGDNALYLDKIPKRLILDYNAAKILQERGFDVGLKNSKRWYSPSFEYYGEEKVLLFGLCSRYFKCELDSKAKILTTFEDFNKEKFPASYKYFSNDCEILVFTFDASTENQSSDVFLSYNRQKQLLDFIGNYPVLKNAPGVYEIVKKDEKSISILIQNIFEDSIFDGEINLFEKYSKMEIIGANATLKDDKIIFNSIIYPYNTVAIYLEK